MTTRRAVLGAGLALLGGCSTTDFGGRPRTAATPSEPSPGSATAEPRPGCDPPTPEPTPELSIANRRSAAVTATVTITGGRTATTDGEPVFEETITVAPGGYADRFEVFPTAGTYVVGVELDDGPTVSETVDAFPDDRRSLVTVTVDDGIEVGIPNVVPEPTPTPCGSAR